MTARLIYMIFLLSAIQQTLPAQGVRIGFGWGLINFQNNVVEKEGNHLLEYGIEGDYRYGFVLKYNIPSSSYRFTSLYYTSEINGSGRIRQTSEENRILYDNVETENSLSTAGLGLEYLFTEKPFIYYAGFNFLLGRFSDVKISYEDKSGEILEDTFTSKTRLGLGAGGGITVAMFPGMDMDINLTYSSLNLLGKKSFEEQISTIDLTVTILFLL